MKKQIADRSRSWTYWFGFAVILLGYLQQNFALIESYLGDSKDLVFFGIGILILVFREITTKPLNQKTAQK